MYKSKKMKGSNVKKLKRFRWVFRWYPKLKERKNLALYQKQCLLRSMDPVMDLVAQVKTKFCASVDNIDFYYFHKLQTSAQCFTDFFLTF